MFVTLPIFFMEEDVEDSETAKLRELGILDEESDPEEPETYVAEIDLVVQHIIWLESSIYHDNATFVRLSTGMGINVDMDRAEVREKIENAMLEGDEPQQAPITRERRSQ